MEEAVSERRKAFAVAYRSDEDRQADICSSQHASYVIAKATAEAWQATCSFLSPKSVYSLFRSVAGSIFSHLPSLLTFATVPPPGNGHQSSLTT